MAGLKPRPMAGSIQKQRDTPRNREYLQGLEPLPPLSLQLFSRLLGKKVNNSNALTTFSEPTKYTPDPT